ncbi:MAG: FISUMP domain-containing protein [Chitinophagaceae bacterium]
MRYYQSILKASAIYLLLLVLSTTLHGQVSTDTLITDSDGNSYPVKVLLDGNQWMTANLKLATRNSYCYDNLQQNCNQYGRLYTWQAARQGCSLLGTGWRLPSNEEWQRLTIVYGGNNADSNAIRKTTYNALLSTGNAGFNAVLGGGRQPDNQYARLEAHGFYWTATACDSTTAWFYNFGKGSQALYQQYGGEKERAFSVRCIRNISQIVN